MSKIQSVRAVDQVIQVLRTSILDGTYAIGSRLPAERTLSTSLGVNRLTLRAAISHLQAEGLLHAQQGQGVTVCDFYETASLELLQYITLEDRLSEVLSLRQMMLADAVSNACTHATVADITRLQSIAGQQSRCANDAEFISGDTRFFRALLDATQNLTLQLLFNSIDRITDSQESWTKHLLENKQQALGSYQALIKLIRHRNPALAKKTLLGHLSDTETLEVTQLLASDS